MKLFHENYRFLKTIFFFSSLNLRYRKWSYKFKNLLISDDFQFDILYNVLSLIFLTCTKTWKFNSLGDLKQRADTRIIWRNTFFGQLNTFSSKISDVPTCGELCTNRVLSPPPPPPFHIGKQKTTIIFDTRKKIWLNRHDS